VPPLVPSIPGHLLQTLPVGTVLPALIDALRSRGTAVLQAPPGTGKTTLVPLALADARPGRVVVAEPRRVAARAAAARMASLLREPVGATVGYAVRGERKVSRDTRVEVVTTGLLVRRMLRDPELPGVGTVLLDEVHERQLDADLALGFALQARELLRDDLWLVAASATLDVPRLAALLDGPVVTATAPVHPLEVLWCPPPRPVRPPEGLRVDPALLDHVSALVVRALAREGDVLTFLPGAGEIRAVANRLQRNPSLVDVDLVELSGRRSGADQDAALRPGPRRRVVLSTAVAESSLTVPGVRSVVDAGLSRVPRIDHARGFGGLDTVRVSRASADQRAGRAAREAPGAVLRAWSPADHGLLLAHTPPEIATADLTAFALLTAGWGDADSLPLLDQPPAGPLAAARDALHRLGALSAGRITPLGERMAAIGLHPRLARALLDGADRVGPRTAAEVVALLSEDSLLRGGDDLVAAWRAADGDPAWRREVSRLRSSLPDRSGSAPVPRDLAAGVVVALAHPERVARRRTVGGSGYATSGGTGVELAEGSGLRTATWLAVAVADRAPGRAAARVRSAAPFSEDLARDVVGVDVRDEVVWRDGDVVARRVEGIGAVELSAKPLPHPPADLVADAVADGVRREGLRLLSFGPATTSLRLRVACCRAAQGDPWPDLGDERLLATLPEWLGAQLAGVRSRRDLTRIDVLAALRALLPWPQAGRLDELAPVQLPVPTGRSVRLDYADPSAPVLSLKLQEAFGWTASPRLVDGRVPVVLHLLSPAGRPLAVTADLESFWRNVYPSVRAENRGRYAKHPWPEDPLTAAPTARTRPRSG
jgi:ATP-dependent helicase HrpB